MIKPVRFVKNREDSRLEFLAGKRVVLLGIGHPLRGDDGAGLELARRLKAKGREWVIEAGNSPENYLGPIIAARPEVILIADAAELGKPPGSWELRSRRELQSGSVSTHDTSIATLMEFLEQEIGAETYLLGIQFKCRKWGEGLGAEVEKAVRELEALFS